jgi:uncharacterized protein (TIGR02145 family)
LTATLDFTLGTDYAKNNFTPVVEGDPVVTYGGAKVRQTYKIILPKTTYPVAGTLTIEDVATTKKQTFNITSIPKYENTNHTPVLVEGQYSEDGLTDERRYWAPVNVGATSTTYSATEAGCGHYFQWGRNVPFIYNTGDTYGGPVYPDTPVEDYETKFITTSADPFDWLSSKDDNLWSGENAQGPCPDGWRVPTEAELTVLINKKTGSVANSRITVTGVGDNLYLPIAGYRGSSGAWDNRGVVGYVWSSTVSTTNARYLNFYNANIEMNTLSRGYGFSVRCIQK